MSSMQTPNSLGFYMPPEWNPHVRTWMAYPATNATCWRDGLPKAREAFAKVAQAIRQFEPVVMCADFADVEDAKRICGPDIEILPVGINDSWTRDTGPTFLVDKKGNRAGVNWVFNGYGGKFIPCDKEDELAHTILNTAGLNEFMAPLVLEGGSIHTDGEGTIITTRQCLLNPNRNPGLPLTKIEQIIMEYTGTHRILWLTHGLPHDWDTDGHVDNVASFVGPGRIVALTPVNKTGRRAAVYNALAQNLKDMASMTDAKGRSLDITVIPETSKAYFMPGGEMLCASYLNFYPVNGGIIVPAFGDKNDDKAANILQDLFPDRKVVQVSSMEITMGGGGIHCITQQEPAAP